MKFLFILYFITFVFSQETKTLDCGETSNTITCTYDPSSSTLTISGEGELSTTLPWKKWTDCVECQDPLKLVITAKITKIPDNAFKSDSDEQWNDVFHKLQTVELPSTVKEIGVEAFKYCESLNTVTIESGAVVTSIGEKAFHGCSQMTSCTIKGAQTIGNQAFYMTSLLTAFDMSSAKTIGQDAFSYSKIKNIEFGKDLESISESSFEGCSDIQSFSVDSGNTKYSSYNDALYEMKDNQKQLISYPPARSSEEYAVADDAKIIVKNAFYDAKNLKKIIFGKSLETVMTEAFYNCYNLETVVFGRSLKNIKQESFSGSKIKHYEVDECNEFFTSKDGILCTKSIGNEAIVKYPAEKEISKKYEIPKGIRVIYDNAFSGVSGLEELVIGNDVYSIHSKAFQGCNSLKKVTITASITSVGSRAFAALGKLEEVYIGKNVQMIGSYMFNECENLKKVTFEAGSQLKTIEQYAFKTTALESIVIPDSVVYIMQNAFAEIYSLKSVTIGKNVVSIGNQCFADCQNLETVTMNSEKLLTIDEEAFYNCQKLESIKIPTTVQIVSNGAFEACVGLKTITYEGSKSPSFCSEVAVDNVRTVKVNVSTAYEKLQFCGIDVTKAFEPPKPEDSSSSETKPNNNDNGVLKTLILAILVLVCLMI